MENEIKVVTEKDVRLLVNLSYCEGIDACCEMIERIIKAMPSNMPIDRIFIRACIAGIRLENQPKTEESKKKLGVDGE